MRRSRWPAAAALAVMISACASTEGPPTADAALPRQIPNQGGSMEGHTPRGFAGSGTGLFAGDNLNPGFPDGDGVQVWLTFDLPALGSAVTCTRVSDGGGLECDVTDAVARAVGAGEDRAQFRLKFETAGDSDGEADLALFFLTDSNTNEPGIFTLDLS